MSTEKLEQKYVVYKESKKKAKCLDEYLPTTLIAEEWNKIQGSTNQTFLTNFLIHNNIIMANILAEIFVDNTSESKYTNKFLEYTMSSILKVNEIMQPKINQSKLKRPH